VTVIVAVIMAVLAALMSLHAHGAFHLPLIIPRTSPPRLTRSRTPKRAIVARNVFAW
jgi:hypothetical protein